MGVREGQNGMQAQLDSSFRFITMGREALLKYYLGRENQSDHGAGEQSRQEPGQPLGMGSAGWLATGGTKPCLSQQTHAGIVLGAWKALSSCSSFLISKFGEQDQKM